MSDEIILPRFDQVQTGIVDWATKEMELVPALQGPLRDLLNSSDSLDRLTKIVMDVQDNYYKEVREEFAEVDKITAAKSNLGARLGLKKIFISDDRIVTMEDTEQTLITATEATCTLVDEDEEVTVRAADGKNITIKDVILAVDAHVKDLPYEEVFMDDLSVWNDADVPFITAELKMGLPANSNTQH